MQLAAIGIINLCRISTYFGESGWPKGLGKIQEQELQHAEPKNWASLYRLFKQFGECNDAALGDPERGTTGANYV